MKKVIFSLLALSATIATPAMANLSSDYDSDGSAREMCFRHSSSSPTVWKNDLGGGAIVANERVYRVNPINAGTNVSIVKGSFSNSQGINLNGPIFSGPVLSGPSYNCDRIRYVAKFGTQESEYISGVALGEIYFSGGTFTNLWKIEGKGNARILVHYSQKDSGKVEKEIYR